MEPAPLRILHLNSLLTGGGTDDQCAKLAYGLHLEKQEVRVVGPGGRDFSKILKDLGVPFEELPNKISKAGLIRAAARIIDRDKIQIIHGHHGRDLWLTVLAAKLSRNRPKIVLTRHMAKSPSSWISRKVLLSQCDGMIAVSKFVKEVLVRGHHDADSPEEERHHRPPLEGDHKKISVLYGGIDTGIFRPGDGTSLRQSWGTQKEHFIFAVAGGYGLPRGKGQREFLKAAAKIHTRIPNARFLIVGRGNMKSILEKDIQQLGLEGKAWLTPYCHDMPMAMKAIDCLVHPQIGTEAFGLVLLEAFACGKPVIATALDGIPEAFEVANFGKLIQPESIAELAQAMIELSSPEFKSVDPWGLHRQVESEFSLAAATGRFLGYYRHVLGVTK